jgi:hypothetical protein
MSASEDEGLRKEILSDECLKMPIWTPSFILVRLLVLLISNV